MFFNSSLELVLLLVNREISIFNECINIMKKILLTAAVILASNSAFAEFGDKIYVKAFGGASMLNQVKDSGNKFKSKATGLLGIAVGSSVMDKVRADISFEHLFSPEFKFSSAAAKSKVKADIDAVSLNVAFDAYQMDMVTFNVNAGMGLALVKAKYSASTPAVLAATSKKATNFTYSVGAGISAAVSDGVNLDLAYNYKDFGKSKAIKNGGSGRNVNFKASSFKGHHVTAGVRFDV